MKLINSHEFTNHARFETWLLERQDIARFNVPECDVIGLRRVTDLEDRMTVMRPDEALIAAQLLIGAVRETTEGYTVSLLESSNGERKEVFRAAVEEGR